MFGNFLQRVKNLVTGGGWQTDEEERRKRQQTQVVRPTQAPQQSTIQVAPPQQQQQQQQLSVVDSPQQAFTQRNQTAPVFDLLQKAPEQPKPEAQKSKFTPEEIEARKARSRAFVEQAKREEARRNQPKTGNVLTRAATSVLAGLGRFGGAGTAQLIGGAIDYATPGKGTNRLSDWGNRKARELDAIARDHGNEAIYRGTQIAGELVSLGATGGATGLIKGASKARQAGDAVRRGDRLIKGVGRGLEAWDNRVVPAIGNTGREAFERLHMPTFGRLWKKGADLGSTSTDLVQDAAFTAKEVAQDTSRGTEITPERVGSDVLLAAGLNPIFSGVSSEVVQPLVKAFGAGTAAEGVGRLRKATNIHGEPSKISVASAPDNVPGPIPGELEKGVASANPAYDNIDMLTPAYQRREPQTIGEAQFQHNRGISNLSDEVFDADARLAPVEPETPTNLDIPAFIRRNPEAILNDVNERLVRADQMIGNLEGAPTPDGALQAQLFDRRQQGVETPTELRQRLAKRNEALVPAREEALKKAIVDKNEAAREGRMAIEVMPQDPAVTTLPEAIPTPPPTAVDATQAPVAARTAMDIDPSPETAPIAPEGAEVTAPVEAIEVPEPAQQADFIPTTTKSGESGATAPRTREQLAGRVSDERIRQDLMENATQKDTRSLAEAQNIGSERVRNLTDDEIVSRYSGGKNMESPEDFFEGLAAVRRLEQIGTEEARRAAVDIMESVTNKSSEAGLWSRATQILFEDAPPTMQADMLMRKLSRAGMDFGDDAVRESEVREAFFDKLSEADRMYRGEIDETGAVRARGALQIKDEAVALANDVQVGAVSPEAARVRAQELAQEYGELLDQWELKNGEIMNLFEKQLPKDKLGSRIGLAARLAMLSSPAGRAFDVISTTFTMLADTGDRTFSALAAKAVGSQRAKTSLPSLRRVFGEAGSGLKRAKEEWQGARRVSDVWSELDMKTRSDIRKTSGFFSRRIKAATEAPTLMSEGIRKDELRRTGMQRAKEAGLEGDAAKVYADLYSIGASKADQYAAKQEWLRANRLHDNKLSDFLSSIGRKLERSGFAGSWLKNITIPFTSFAGGNIQQALTDRNIVYNVYQIAKGLNQHNPQAVADGFGRLATNVAAMTAASMVLAEAGLLTDKDANGKGYDGVYLKFGDYHIPVAFAGQFAPALIGGYALNKALAADNPVDGLTDFIANSAIGVAKSTDMTSIFGGDNSLMNRFGDVAEIGFGEEGAGKKFTDLLIKLGGDTVRQYIPSLTGDVNAVLDQTSLNPTGEAAETKVTKENPETGNQITDVPATELAKTKNRIPGLSQTLPRKEGSLAKNPLDRIMKSTRLSSSQKQAQADEKAAQEKSASLAERGIPDYKSFKTIDDFNAAIENLAYDGEFGKAIEGLENRFKDMESDPTVSRSSKEKIRRQITEYKVLEKGGFSMEDLETYESIGVEDWRKLGDPKSGYYNKDAYERLWAIDQALAKEKVGGGRGLNKNGQKYYAKKSGSGGSGGGRGGRGGGANAALRRVQSNTVGSPISLGKVDFGRLQGQSVGSAKIPTINKIKPSDLIKKRKISVSRG